MPRTLEGRPREPDFKFNEAASNANITLTRTGGSDGAVQVDFATGGTTATPDEDYTPTTGSVVFDDLETSKSFTIPMINDMKSEAPATVDLTLSNFRP